MKNLVPLSVKGLPWWRSPQVFGFLVVSLVLALQISTGVFGRLERAFYDFASSHNPHQPSAQVVLIAIDDKSLASLGPWPWPRHLHARLIDTLAAAKPKVVVDTVPFFEPQPDHGLAIIQKMKTLLSQAVLPADVADGVHPGPDPVRQQLAALIAQAESELDGDTRLASSLQQAGNVLLAANPTPGRVTALQKGELPPYILSRTLESPAKPDQPSRQMRFPIERLGAAGAGIGYFELQPDEDGVVRSEPLLVNVQGKMLPSMALLAAASSQGLKASDIGVVRGQGLQLGQMKIATDASGTVLPQFYSQADGMLAFAQDSFADVLTGQLVAAKYADKVVIIGVTATANANATGLGRAFAAPGHAAMTSAEMLAHRTSNLLQGHAAHQPPWAIWVLWVTAIVAAAWVVLGLPALGTAATLSLSLALCGSLLLAQFWLLRTMNLSVPLVFPATLLALGYVLQLLYSLVMRHPVERKPAHDPDQTTDRMMGLALQGQGELDMAFERFRRIPMHPALAQDMYWLAVDFERRQLFAKAQAVYQCIMAFDESYKDVKERLARAGAMDVSIETGAATERPGVTARVSGNPQVGTHETLMLGRYQVVKELGQGAMGAVYLGKDPKIGRPVALKTMALGQEFDGIDLVEARERFFREAKAAGRLQHPSIVTIFDVGEAHDLAFIAMEYVKGQDLQQHCKRAGLLPIPQVVSIVARVAQALDYAHRLQVIHRDIKPSNVMYDGLTDTVKVTDFGIARITDGSKTRTGVVMGTPSYMSPEQLAGQPLDGRSDLYSLGIMLFQLLTGSLPFKANSMAQLMSKIATEHAPDVRQLRGEISAELATLVTRLLCKSPGDRYQDGETLAADLVRCSGRPQVGMALAKNKPSRLQTDVRVGSIDLE